MLLLKFNVCKAMRFAFFAQKMFVLVHDNEPRIMQKVTQKNICQKEMRVSHEIYSIHKINASLRCAHNSLYFY